jgi:hypothetical protein
MKDFQIFRFQISGLMIKLFVLGCILPTALIYVLPGRSQPNNISLSRNFRPDPIKAEGTAGGNISLVSLAGVEAKCRGFAGSQPNHVIELTTNFPMLDILAYAANVNTDLTMLIKGSNGAIICADDEHQRRNPQLSKRLPQGTYEIWVGLAEQNKSSSYSLSISESSQK